MRIMAEDTDLKDLPGWLSDAAAGLQQRLETGRMPHALLVHGPAGTGRGLLVDWLARRLLELPAGASGELVHPDYRRIGPEPDRDQITVAQVRELVEFMGLMASGGARKVAVINPAEAMNVNASNALLKTLEEPPGEGVLILVAAAPGVLPPTITSRCQRLRVGRPPAAAARDWLVRLEPTVADWDPYLALAGGAPLLAAELARTDRAGDEPFLAALAADLEAVIRREEGPVPVARRWARGPADLALRWLHRQVAGHITARADPRIPSTGPRITSLQTPAGDQNMAPWFAYLDRVQLARRQLDRGLNTELVLADLLLWWVGRQTGAR
jgi:DNA polymerase-3 subunit delta'